jgi:signal transduction histidine kinase
MQVPVGGFVAAVERVSRALEQLASAASVPSVLDEVARSAAVSMGTHLYAVVWRDEEGRLQLQASPGLEPASAKACARLLLEGPPRREDAPWVFPGPARAELPAAAVERLGASALLGLPIHAAGQGRVGVLLVLFPVAQAFSEHDITRFGLYARLVSLAVERTRLVSSARAAASQAELAGQRLQLLADAGVLLSSSLEWESTVAGVARLALGSFAEWCAVDFLDDEGALRRLTVLYADSERTLLPERLAACTPERTRPSALGDVVRTGQAQLVTGVGPGREGSFLIVPLLARQRSLGTLSFTRGPGRAPYNEADRALAEDLAARVGLAIDNARLLREARAAEAEARRSAARLRTLVEVDRLLAEAGLQLPAVLDVLVRTMSELLGDGCVIQLLSEDAAWLEPVSLHHPDAEARRLLAGTVHVRRRKVGEGLHGGVIARGRAVLLPEVDGAALEAVGALDYQSYVERRGPQSLLVVPLRGKDRVCGTLGVVRDLAGRPYSEEDRLLLQSLADRAALAIEDARLYGAATEAVRLRDDFLSVAGHELKTPLSALRLQIQMLARTVREAASTPGLAERVEKAEQTSARLAALMDALMDTGRINAGRLELRPEELDLAALARDAVGRMSEALARAGCEVRLVADTPTPGRWDKLRLEQVVSNLLSNAAKYGGGQPVEVRVEAGEGWARFVVRDGGIGISPENQARIFDRYERAVTDKEFQGLGLGLWICREIVSAHGGEIRVQSAPGQGSTFTVELPLGKSP